jgi:hypothetical protein
MICQVCTNNFPCKCQHPTCSKDVALDVMRAEIIALKAKMASLRIIFGMVGDMQQLIPEEYSTAGETTYDN